MIRLGVVKLKSTESSQVQMLDNLVKIKILLIN